MPELSSDGTRRAQLRAPQLDPAVVVLCGHLPVAIAASWQKIPYFVGPIMVFGHAQGDGVVIYRMLSNPRVPKIMLPYSLCSTSERPIAALLYNCSVPQ